LNTNIIKWSDLENLLRASLKRKEKDAKLVERDEMARMEGIIQVSVPICFKKDHKKDQENGEQTSQLHKVSINHHRDKECTKELKTLGLTTT
jgi:type III secretory pathway lipoprotein EscJ